MDNLYIRIPASGGLWQGWHVKGQDRKSTRLNSSH